MNPHFRKHQKAKQDSVAQRRRKVLALRAQKKTVNDIAVAVSTPISTVYRDLSTLQQQAAALADFAEYRTVQKQELETLKEVVLSSRMSDGKKVDRFLAIIDRLMRLCGTAAESKAVIAHVSGPKLDSLYLDVRAILMDLPREDQEEGLEHLRSWAKNRKPPVTVTVLMLEDLTAKMRQGEGEADANLS
jgi:hypothetical protein